MLTTSSSDNLATTAFIRTAFGPLRAGLKVDYLSRHLAGGMARNGWIGCRTAEVRTMADIALHRYTVAAGLDQRFTLFDATRGDIN